MKANKHGFALISVLSMLVVLMALIAAYFMLTRIELGTTKASQDQTSGYYAAEAGLNLRAEEIRKTFVGYNRPTGSSPTTNHPCQGGDLGSGDFACKKYVINGRTVWTYVIEDPDNPDLIRIPPGELFQNLNAQEYRYSAFSVAYGPEGEPEAILEMRFKSRLVPLFQFAAFYTKDLEILPGPDMVLEGPVHSNKDLYLNANNTLRILGQVTTAGNLYRGRKDRDACSGTVTVPDASNNDRALPCKASSFDPYSEGELAPWGGNIRIHVDPLTVPSVGSIKPEPGRLYWDKADLRVGLDLSSTPPAIKVYRQDRTVDPLRTSALNGCAGSVGGKAVGYSTSFYNAREEKWIAMLEVDVQALLTCAHRNSLLEFLVPGDPTSGVRDIDDTTDGGLVVHFTVFGPKSDDINNYGVRVRNGAELKATSSGAPEIKGLTIVTDQAVYIQGDYNAVNKKPAAFLADSLNVLSNAWDDSKSGKKLKYRVASETTINAAFLAGTDLTGGADGTDGQGKGNYNGGLENYPRFHEKWTGKTLHYHGSFVSLGTPEHVNGPWCGTGASRCGHDDSGRVIGIYTPPRRDWHYDTDFNDAANLPPLTPRFVYLRQELFERAFEQR